MSFVAIISGCCALSLFIVQRLVWLAPTRAGWLFYLANIVGEIGPKRLGVRRELLEASVASAGVVLLAVGGTPIFVVALVIILLLAQVALLQRHERRFLVTAWTRQDRFGPDPAEPELLRGLARGYPAPSTHPELTVTLIGPFVTRWPRLDIGTLVIGRRITLEVVVCNHTLTPTQSGILLHFELPACLHTDSSLEQLLSPLAPGKVHRVSITLNPVVATPRSRLLVQVIWGDTTCTHRIEIQSITSECYKVRNAAIRRYPGACRSAFAWRGDMDIYDTSTLQSIAGLEVTFGLAARYRMPQTMYLSTRLTLDETASRSWAEHYGIDRGAGEIPRFIQWMCERVELCHRADYPFESDRPYLIELGNHGHLHFGNDTAAAAENGWRLHARMGAGVYPWLGAERGSFAEQRDNALEARRWCENLFSFTPRSWAMPDRTRDKSTAAAMEAAGCEVLSDSDVRMWDNILRQPKPHFAPGSGSVELTKRYPGDPQHLLHYWMNLFWIHRAHRLGIPVLFMCHQHMRMFDSWACTRFTESILRHVLHAFSGDLWINTVYGIGVYWRDVLSERRAVERSLDNGVVTVRSRAKLAHLKVPVDLELEGGGHATVLVDLEPGSEVRLDARGLL